MPIVLKNSAVKWAMVVIEAAVLVFLVGWVAKDYLAVLIAKKPSIRGLDLAEKYSPGDAYYPHMQGRLFLYSLSDVNPVMAVTKMMQAVQLNTYEPQAWLDLGAALELQGDVEPAEQSLRRADFLAPRQPGFQWAIANFFILHGNVDEAFKHLKMVLASDPSYDAIIFNTAWKASGDANTILQELIPNSVYSEFRYLYFLIGTKRFPEADAVWNRIISGPEQFDASLTSGYIENLIGQGKPEDAYHVWQVLRSKGMLSPTYEQTTEDLIENGNFEEKLINYGFDWRLYPFNGVYIGLDQTTFHSPAHSLLVQFDGKANYDFHNVYQFVIVKPDSSYQFRAFMKTDGITTDSGPRIEIKDAYAPQKLDVTTQNLVGTTPGWVLISQDFRTGPKTRLIVIMLRRFPSQKFDNLLAGKVWLDDVTLTETSGRK